jgi:hypothetical protein
MNGFAHRAAVGTYPGTRRRGDGMAGKADKHHHTRVILRTGLARP